MDEKPHTQLLREPISSLMDENVHRFKEILNLPVNSDAIFKDYTVGEIRMCIIYIEGMADDKKIGEFVLHALKGARELSERNIDVRSAEGISSRLVEIAQTRPVTQTNEAIQMILAGMTCMLIDGSEEALIMETRNYPHRSVDKPTNEAVVIGPQEAFNEHLRTNISLIRRYVQSHELVSERIIVGKRVPTQVNMLYLNGVASESCIKEMKRRLMCIQSDSVLGCGELQQLIEDRPLVLLPQMLQTERPDRAASCILDGQVALLVENSPYALIAPVTFFHLIHSSDDSFLRWQYGSALRLVRMLGLIVSLILPSLYIAMSLHHTHLIPMALLTSIAESRSNVPFPIIVEVLFMEFSFYLLNEAGLRTPTQIGSAFGVVGALILGQAAVSASIISPILIIIIAITGLGNYVIPNYGFGVGLIIYRLILIVLSGAMGLYGLTIGLFLIITHLCSVKSFGIDYFAPISPRRPHNPDIILRLPVWLQKKAMFFAKQNCWMGENGGKK